MSRRNGNDYKLVIGKETTYGAASVTSLLHYPDSIEMNDTTAVIDVSTKTGTLIPGHCSKIKGITTGTVTIKGQFTLDKIMLLELFNKVGTATYTPFIANQVSDSWTIYRLWDESTDDVADIATGCVLETFKLTADGGNILMYEATLRTSGKINREARITGGLTYTSQTACTVFPHYDSVYTRGASAVKYNSMSITYSRTFVDDAKAFQNSLVKGFDLITDSSAVLEIEWNYDTATDSVVYDNILGTVILDKFDFDSSSSDLEISTYGKYTSYDAPDPDNGIFTGKLTKDLLYDGTNDWLKFIVA